MSISLSQILNLVGRLDDTPGTETPRERFRRFLKENVSEVGQVRDYIEECLRNSGEQYNRALQDLVNHLGQFLGFEVTYGRFQGVQGQLGFDGHWKSRSNFHIVVEVKTTDVYAIKTSTLIGYVDSLISEKRIPSWDQAIGLYMIGRPDAEIKQLENAIVAERRTHQLRTITVGALLSLAELMSEYEVSHDNILAIMQPSGPAIDSIVELMEHLVTGARAEAPAQPEMQEAVGDYKINPVETGASYWLTPVKSYKEESAEECISRLVGKERIYAFGDRTPGRRWLKPGDWLCFYANGKGVIAHARVKSAPERCPHSKVRQPEKYPWVFHLDDVRLYFDQPKVIDAEMRGKLEAFRNRDPAAHWAWFVQATRRISKHDFGILIAQSI